MADTNTDSAQTLSAGRILSVFAVSESGVDSADDVARYAADRFRDGAVFSPDNSLMLANAPPHQAGMVSGLFGTLRQSGYALGFALSASLFTAV